MASNGYVTPHFLTQPLTEGLAHTAGLNLGAMGCVPGLRPAAPAPSTAQLQHDGCARRRGEPRVEQLPGNRLLSRPTLRPLSPSQGPFFFSSSSFLTGARPCGAGEKLQPMPPAAPVTVVTRHRHRGSWEPMAPGGEQRGGSGRERDGGEWEAQPGCEKFCWDTSLPDYHRPPSLHTPKPCRLP